MVPATPTLTQRSVIAVLSAIFGLLLGLIVINLSLRNSPLWLVQYRLGFLALGGVFGFNLGVYLGIRHWCIAVPPAQSVLPTTPGNLSPAFTVPPSNNTPDQKQPLVRETVYSPDINASFTKAKIGTYTQSTKP